MRTIAVIGGGASGLFAAIFAAGNPDNKVIIIEKNAKLGKKILVTGNGRCNFTNLDIKPSCYNRPEFAKKILNAFSLQDTLRFFEERGLMYASDEEGRVYPRSYNAETVLDILVRELKKPNIEVLINTEVTALEKQREQFIIKCIDREITSDALIVTAGGRVGFNKVEDNFRILRNFDLKITDLCPALVPLKTSKSDVKGLSGIRVKAEVTLLKGGKALFSERGEVLFKDEGLSGIAVFNASLVYQRNKGEEMSISLDLLPEMSIKDIISRFKSLNLPSEQFLNGIFNPKISLSILRKSKSEEIEKIAKIIKNFNFAVTGTYGFESAQITSGGIDVSEVYDTLQSKKYKNLYFAGEILDIDGMCGGYNLQWAWSSGAVAGLNAIK